MKSQRLYAVYETSFSLMAIFSVVLAFLDLSGEIVLQSIPILYWADNCILVIFAADYFIRLVLSKEKGAFVRENIPDLIAIIPFSAFFKVFRMAKLFRLVKIARLSKLSRATRIFALLLKFKKTARRFLYTNGLIYILAITGGIILLGAVGIYFFEHGTTVDTFWDALWWSFVTATTVGYGDISPSTAMGRLLAGALMICGIGTIGMLTGSVATYFIKDLPSVQSSNPNQILDLCDLNLEQFNAVVDYANYIRKK